MLFKHVSEIFEQISKVSSRNEITKLLAQLFSEASPKEVQILTYLTLGLLRPPYETTQFKMAEKSIANVLAELFELSATTIIHKAHELGDLGAVAAQGNWKFHKNLSVEDVYENLSKLEVMGGTGSQEEKAKFLIELLKDVDPLSAQIIVRIILGVLRMGFSDMTIVDALSWMIAGDKSLHHKIEHAYNVCADLGHIAFILRKEGEKGLDSIDIVVGIPIRPAAAERMPSAAAIFKKLGPCIAQPKLDGFRLQVHDFRSGKERKVRFFSRNLIDMSYMFPDLLYAFEKYKISSVIVEGEAICYDEKHDRFLPFQETVKRKRKHGIEQMTAAFPLKLFLFDIFYYNGESQLAKPHHERRELLLKIFSSEHEKSISVIDEKVINSAQELEDYFEECKGIGLEGLVVKKPDAIYQPGKRNFNWIKLKSEADELLEDTLDCVILGYYYGSGKRSTFGIGAFLVGIYDIKNDRFETIAKVGTGLKDEEWRELKKKCDEKKIPEKLHNVFCSKELYPDIWVSPEIVCTVKADEITFSPLHTAGKTSTHDGFALRFPRFVQYRLDKSANETTTLDEIKRLREDQKSKVLKKKES